MATNAPSHIQEGSAAGLLEFCDYLISRGYGTAGAVGPWKSAARQVFVTVSGDDFGAIDVRSLDLDDHLSRFETLSLGELKVESVQAYRRRFTQAVEAYRAFLDTGKTPTFKGKGSRRTKSEQPVKPTNGTKPATPAMPVTPAASADPMIDYPFPLRNGQVAMLRLPVRIEKADAERLAAFVRTLVFEPMLELGPGGDEDDE